MRATMVAAGAALMVCHAPAHAQAAGESSAIQTLVATHAWPGAGQMRAAGPVGDTGAWLTDADIPDAIRADAAGQSAGVRHQIILAQVGLSMTVEADDSISECHGTYGKSELAPQLCALLRARGHFRHALATDGTPIRSEATMTVQYSIVGPDGNAGLPPSPMMPQGWPLLYYNPGIAMAQPPEWPKAKDKEVAILLDFGREGPPRCRAIKSSGDPALDKAACAAAATGTYQRTETYGQLPMIVTWTGKKASVLLPAGERGTAASPVAGKPFAIRGVPHPAGSDEATAYVDVDDAGRALRCRIYNSAGSDAADVALCNQLMAARFNPARDVFGRPLAGPANVPARFE